MHEYAGDYRSFEPQMRYFSRQHRCVTYSQRGYPPSDVPRDSARYSQDIARDDVIAVMDALAIDKAHVVGHSMGAYTALHVGIEYPQRCRSLVIIAQGADYEIAPHPFIWLLHELFVRLPVEHFLPAWFLRRIVINYIMAPRRAAAKPIPSLPRHLIEEQFSKIELWPFVYKFSVLPVIHYYDMRARLDALTMPILLINRLDDVLSPEAKPLWLSQQLPNCAGYYVVPGGERLFMYSQAETVNQLIEQFLLK